MMGSRDDHATYAARRIHPRRGSQINRGRFCHRSRIFLSFSQQVLADTPDRDPGIGAAVSEIVVAGRWPLGITLIRLPELGCVVPDGEPMP